MAAKGDEIPAMPSEPRPRESGSASERFCALLDAELCGICALSAEQAAELYRHYCLLVRWNRVLNLSSVTKLEEAITRHYCESAFLAVHLPSDAGSVLDVGSGAGFPGSPVAVMRPNAQVTLAESHQRKAVFLREATRHLPNVRVAAERAEGIPGQFAWVISRAVRWEAVLPVVQEGVALLLGAKDGEAARQDRRICWDAPVALPWGRERVLLKGMFAKTNS